MSKNDIYLDLLGAIFMFWNILSPIFSGVSYFFQTRSKYKFNPRSPPWGDSFKMNCGQIESQKSERTPFAQNDLN